jgi:hypothetical protein
MNRAWKNIPFRARAPLIWQKFRKSYLWEKFNAQIKSTCVGANIARLDDLVEDSDDGSDEDSADEDSDVRT